LARRASLRGYNSIFRKAVGREPGLAGGEKNEQRNYGQEVLFHGCMMIFQIYPNPFGYTKNVPTFITVIFTFINYNQL